MSEWLYYPCDRFVLWRLLSHDFRCSVSLRDLQYDEGLGPLSFLLLCCFSQMSCWGPTWLLKEQEAASWNWWSLYQYTYLSPLPAYQPRHRMMWASYLVPLLYLSLPHLHGGRYLLFISLDGRGVATLSLELTSWNRVSWLRPWNSWWFHCLSQSPRWIPKFHLPKNKASVFFHQAGLARNLYSFVQCCWSSHVWHALCKSLGTFRWLSQVSLTL